MRFLAAKTWIHPVTGRDVHYTAVTIERWYYKARSEKDDPVGALRRAVRRDCGKVSLPAVFVEHLLLQYHEHKHWSYQLHYDNLTALANADSSLGPLPSYSTVRRYMKAHGLVSIRAPESKDCEIAQRELELPLELTSSADTWGGHLVVKLILKGWLLDIIVSKATPETVRKGLRLANLDHITEVARNGTMALRKRALAILARSKGFSRCLVADCLKMSDSTVSRAYDEFRHSNDPLRVLRRRPRRRDDDKRRRMTNSLIETLHHKPIAFGINRSNWTLRCLADVYEKQYGERISERTVRRRFKEAGYSRKKSRQVLTSPDPKYRERVELVLTTLQSMNASEMFFFLDELGPLQVRRYGGRCYTPKKKIPTHPQSRRSKGSIIFHAALSATTNQLTWLYGDAKDTAGMIDLIELLFNQYHDKSRLYITWDAASWHSSHQLMEWVDELNAGNRAHGNGPIVEFVPLPTSSQFLNVIETVFGTMKKTVIHGSDYQSEEDMKTAISWHFRERNEFFKHNPRRAGKKIWEIDFFEDSNNIRWGDYREW
jgi:transposase